MQSSNVETMSNPEIEQEASVNILCFVRFYKPGYRYGGPIKSIFNMVENIGKKYKISIVTTDRDVGDEASYPSIAPMSWNVQGSAKVFYVTPGLRGMYERLMLLTKTPHDILYLNGLTDSLFTLPQLLISKIYYGSKKPIILAPRGELNQGALAHKKIKKIIFLRIAKKLSLFKSVIWHATCPEEEEDITRIFGYGLRIYLSRNIPHAINQGNIKRSYPGKKPNLLRIVFFSRINPKKNLDYALNVLRMIQSQVEFSIYGPEEDARYAQHCRILADQLPTNIKVFWGDAISPNQVVDMLSQHDLFFLPTKGENFGHVITEAISAGLPLLLSDTTPWRNLASKGVGLELPLDNPDRFVDCIQYCAELGQEEYSEWRARVLQFASEQLDPASIVKDTQEMFYSALHGNTSTN